MLKAQTVKSAKATGKTYYLNDGDNLRLKVDPKGRKYWDVRYRLNGKRVDHRIGAYPRYSLVEARQERTKLLEKVDEGVSPTGKPQKDVYGSMSMTPLATSPSIPSPPRW